MIISEFVSPGKLKMYASNLKSILLVLNLSPRGDVESDLQV